jgi:hypothetical protein
MCQDLAGTVIFVLGVILWTIYVMDVLLLGKGQIRLSETQSKNEVALLMGASSLLPLARYLLDCARVYASE